MGAHFRKPHCPQGCWADRWALSGSLTLSFLLHCATETLTPQIQILPHFAIAELQVYSLGRWIRKPNSSRTGERGRSCSRKPCKEYKLWFKLKYPFHFSKLSLTIRECSKFDSGSGRSSASPNRSHVNRSLCFKLSLLLLSHKLVWSTHPLPYLQPWPAGQQKILWASSFGFHEASQSQHPASLRRDLWTSQGSARRNRSQAPVYDTGEIGPMNEILSQSKLLPLISTSSS